MKTFALFIGLVIVVVAVAIGVTKLIEIFSNGLNTRKKRKSK